MYGIAGRDVRYRIRKIDAISAQIGQPTYIATDGGSVFFIDFDAMRGNRDEHPRDRNGCGRPAPSVRVDFTAPSSRPSCSFASGFAITNADGVADAM